MAEPEADFGDEMGGEPAPSSDKPFDDEPFDAGVEADEETDPKKYIEQLTGKLGQSLRKFTEDQGQPDFELEKFAINSLLSATHTSEMDEEDKKDIISKVNTAGDGDSENDSENVDNNSDANTNDDNLDNSGDGDALDFDSGDEDLEETILEKEEGFLIKPKRSSIFAPEGSEEANFKHKIVEKLHESFNQEEDMSEPTVEPEVAPAPVKTPSVDPVTTPSRKNKPFLPMPSVDPDPKAKK
jgi:hypothetical protein